MTEVGSRGDGLAETADARSLYIPYAAPGDRARVAIGPARGDGFEARLDDVIESGQRAEPVCPHFGSCGGCSVQHLPKEVYARWKRDILVTALAQRGLTPEVLDLMPGPLGVRRRVTFNAFMGAVGPVVGFMERRGNRVIDIASCPLLVPELEALLDPLRLLLADLLAAGEKAKIAVALVGGNIDLVLEWNAAVDLKVRELLADFAEAQDLARLSLRDDSGLIEPLAQRRPVTASFGQGSVPLPPDGFMQPSEDGEDQLRAIVLEGAKGARRIIELFAGAGTFTLPLAELAPVHAVDGDADLIGALATAAGRAGLGGKVTTAVRDLAKRPLLAAELSGGLAGEQSAELAGVDTVVLDPPRAGALKQVEQIAQALPISRVIMASCNPATFARDARVLVDGGFRMGQVQPVDQFLFSHHLECVAVFSKG